MECVDLKKRYPEDSLSDCTEKRHRSGENEIVSRLCLSSSDFGKCVGRGGQMITNIRTKCGVVVRGSDINEDERLLQISGNVYQVIEAFDMFSEVLHSSYTQSTQNCPFSIRFLIDHRKAGKVVGIKGNTIRSLKVNSGCSTIHLSKDVQSINGLVLRELSIEGTLQAVRRAHLYVLSLCYDTSANGAQFNSPFHAASPESYPNLSPALLDRMLSAQTPSTGLHQSLLSAPSSIQHQQDMQSHSGMTGGPGIGGGGDMFPGLVSSAARLPSNALVPIATLHSMGVHSDAISRLVDIQRYLQQVVGGIRPQCPHPPPPPPQALLENMALDSSMSVQHMNGQLLGGPVMSSAGHLTGLMNSRTSKGSGIGAHPHQHVQLQSVNYGSPSTSPANITNSAGDGEGETCKLEFLILHDHAGSIIGRNGQTLRELMQDTGCRIQVGRERGEHGMRKVTIMHMDEQVVRQAMAVVLQRLPASVTSGGSLPVADGIEKEGSYNAQVDADTLDP